MSATDPRVSDNNNPIVNPIPFEHLISVQGTPSVVVLHRMVSGIDGFSLMAVPFFILAGHLMSPAGITTRVFEFAKAIVGRLHGGLGHVNIGASIVFAGMSSAAVADAGGLGTMYQFDWQSLSIL